MPGTADEFGGERKPSRSESLARIPGAGRLKGCRAGRRTHRPLPSAGC
jgi:hypothetical protein